MSTSPRILVDDDSLDAIIDDVLIAHTSPLQPAPRVRALPPPLPPDALPRSAPSLPHDTIPSPPPSMLQWSMPPKVAPQPRHQPITVRSMAAGVRRALFGASVLRGALTFLVGAALMLLVQGLGGSRAAAPQLAPYIIHVTSTPAEPVVTPLAPVETVCPTAAPAAHAKTASPRPAVARPSSAGKPVAQAVRRHHSQRAEWAKWVDPFAD